MSDHTDDDFERNVAEIRHCAQVRSTGEDSICIRLCDRILSDYRTLRDENERLVKENAEWEDDWIDEYERNKMLLLDLSPKQRLDYDNWKLWRDKALTMEADYLDLKAQYDSAYAAAMTNADALTDAVAERDALRVRLIDALIAMRNWGAQEDGIPGGDIGAWQAYMNGAVLLGWCIDPEYAVEREGTE